MVKRKAETSLDEWLDRGTLYVEANRARIAAVPAEEPPEPPPTAVTGPSNQETTSLPTGSA